MLRPLTVGEILDTSFSLYRRHFGALATVALVCTGIPLVLRMFLEASGGCLLHLRAGASLRPQPGGAEPRGDRRHGLHRLGELPRPADLRAGGAPPRDAVHRPDPRLLAAHGAGGRTRLHAARHSRRSILAVGLVLAIPAVVLEPRTSASGALSRSWELTRGSRWRIFGLGDHAAGAALRADRRHHGTARLAAARRARGCSAAASVGMVAAIAVGGAGADVHLPAVLLRAHRHLLRSAGPEGRLRPGAAGVDAADGLSSVIAAVQADPTPPRSGRRSTASSPRRRTAGPRAGAAPLRARVVGPAGRVAGRAPARQPRRVPAVRLRAADRAGAGAGARGVGRLAHRARRGGAGRGRGRRPPARARATPRGISARPIAPRRRAEPRRRCSSPSWAWRSRSTGRACSGTTRARRPPKCAREARLAADGSRAAARAGAGALRATSSAGGRARPTTTVAGARPAPVPGMRPRTELALGGGARARAGRRRWRWSALSRARLTDADPRRSTFLSGPAGARAASPRRSERLGVRVETVPPADGGARFGRAAPYAHRLRRPEPRSRRPAKARTIAGLRRDLLLAGAGAVGGDPLPGLGCAPALAGTRSRPQPPAGAEARPFPRRSRRAAAASIGRDGGLLGARRTARR